jgi:hypothetical protein
VVLDSLLPGGRQDGWKPQASKTLLASTMRGQLLAASSGCSKGGGGLLLPATDRIMARNIPSEGKPGA